MPDQPDMPSEAGQRPFIDRDGEVHGSGAGAGGGQAGEDFDQDAGSGDGYPQTGGEGTEHVPGSRGPTREQ